MAMPGAGIGDSSNTLPFGARAESEALLESIINHAPTPIFMKDPEGNYLYVNSAYALAAGIPLEKILGRTDFDLFPPEVARAYRHNDVRAMRETTPIQRVEPVPADGEERTFTVVKFPIFNEKGEVAGICGISVDITDSVKTEHDRAEERKRIATEIHDDAVQVMAAVALRLESLERDARLEDPEGRLTELRLSVIEATLRLRTLMSDLQAADMAEGELRDSLRMMLEEIEGEHSITWAMDDRIEDASPLPGNLYRIAREALINITKHAQASHIDVSLAELNGGIRMTIADDGIGFDESIVRSRGHMGLSSMRAKAQAIRGELTIHSRLNGGTRVVVWLPFSDRMEPRSSDA